MAYYFWGATAVGGLDFQEFFHEFLGRGRVTYAVLFAGAIYVTALVFGRLFCSWGCHFGATQDLAAWILRRLGWRPPLVRTRFLHWSPFLVLGFVFLWPSLETWLEAGWSLAPVRGPGDLAGAGPWERLPGWFLSIVTFTACGAGILLCLGTRGFCRFVCPYGAIFRLTDAVAPFRVRRTADCAPGCGAGSTPPCTQVCPTAIDVHAETEASGAVHSADCVRCNLCIEACPAGALAHTSSSSYRPLPVLSAPEPRVAPVPAGGAGAAYTLGAVEEAVVLAVALGAFAAADRVYGGHFLAATLALGEGLLAVLCLRLLRRRDVRFQGTALRHRGALGLGGITALGVFVLTWVPLYQAAAFKIHRHGGLSLAKEAGVLATPEERKALLQESSRRLRAALAHFPERECRLALVSNYQLLGDPRALQEVADLARRFPRDLRVLEARRLVLLGFGRPKAAELVARDMDELRKIRGERGATH